MERKGKALKVLPAGDRRRLSDMKNGWRKATLEQRQAFIHWIFDEQYDTTRPAGLASSKDEYDVVTVAAQRPGGPIR